MSKKNIEKHKSKGSLSNLFDDPLALIKRMVASSVLAEQQAFNEVKFCVTPGCTEEDFAWCHVIPSSAQLKGLSEKGKLCWLPMLKGDLCTTKPFWSISPISKTIIFRGFCSKCDASIFKKVDQPLSLDKETFALLAYRAACYFNWRAEVDLRGLMLEPVKLRELITKGMPLPPLKDKLEEVSKPEIQSAIRHRDGVATIMDAVRSSVTKGDYDFLETKTFEFGCELPFRYSLAATFSSSLLGEYVNISTTECPQIPALFIHFLNIDGTTKLIFSWMKCVPDRYVDDWLRQFQEYSESGHLADVLLRYMFINNHGLVLRPSFLNTLNENQTEYLTQPLRAATYFIGEVSQPAKFFTPPLFDLNWKLIPVKP